MGEANSHGGAGVRDGAERDALVLALYASARERDPWRQVLGLLVRYFALSSGAALQPDGTGWLVRAGAGEAWRSRECRSAAGRDGPGGERHHVLTCALDIADAPFVLRLHRPRGRAALGACEEAQLKGLKPHIEAALTMAGRVAQMDSQRLLYETALERSRIGAIFLDSVGDMLKANAVALALLAEGDGLGLIDGKLVGRCEADSATLRDLLGSARTGGEQVFAATLSRAAGKGGLALTARAIPDVAGGKAAGNPAVAMFVRDAEARTTMKVDELSQFYGLTASEARLSIELAKGLNLNDAAGALGIRRNTARAYLRSIFSKTGVSRQTDLLRLLII